MSTREFFGLMNLASPLFSHEIMRYRTKITSIFMKHLLLRRRNAFRRYGKISILDLQYLASIDGDAFPGAAQFLAVEAARPIQLNSFLFLIKYVSRQIELVDNIIQSIGQYHGFFAMCCHGV